MLLFILTGRKSAHFEPDALQLGKTVTSFSEKILKMDHMHAKPKEKKSLCAKKKSCFFNRSWCLQSANEVQKLLVYLISFGLWDRLWLAKSRQQNSQKNDCLHPVTLTTTVPRISKNASIRNNCPENKYEGWGRVVIAHQENCTMKKMVYVYNEWLSNDSYLLI